jgi:hypothetical protein
VAVPQILKSFTLTLAFCLILFKELKELSALAYRDTTAENREFWKNEMGNALREIQHVYDDKMDSMRGEMETFYNLKVSQMTLVIIYLLE